VYGADPYEQELKGTAKEILSQEYYDTHLKQHRDEIRQHTEKTFPDLFDHAVVKQENGFYGYRLNGLIKLHQATDLPTLPPMYPIYWLSVAQGLAENSKSFDEKTRETLQELVRLHSESYVANIRLKQIEILEENDEKEREIRREILSQISSKDEQVGE